MSGKPMQIFLDANALIYLLEGNSAIAERTRATLAGIRQRHPHASLAISELSCLECRVKPLRENDKSLLARYDGFFAQPDLLRVELDMAVIERATLLRARYGLRTPDALQAACCLQLGPNHQMLTGDAAFDRVDDLNVKVIRL